MNQWSSFHLVVTELREWIFQDVCSWFYDPQTRDLNHCKDCVICIWNTIFEIRQFHCCLISTMGNSTLKTFQICIESGHSISIWRHCHTNVEMISLLPFLYNADPYTRKYSLNIELSLMKLSENNEVSTLMSTNTSCSISPLAKSPSGLLCLAAVLSSWRQLQPAACNADHVSPQHPVIEHPCRLLTVDCYTGLMYWLYSMSTVSALWCTACYWQTRWEYVSLAGVIVCMICWS